MIIEIIGVGNSKNIFVLNDIISVAIRQEFTSYDTSPSKWTYYLDVTFKTNRVSISYLDNETQRNENYLRLLEALKLFYAKDSVKDMIKKVLNEQN